MIFNPKLEHRVVDVCKGVDVIGVLRLSDKGYWYYEHLSETQLTVCQTIQVEQHVADYNL